ncbi:MAG TPA: long-chain fatty acid--CoA ligase [Candidatus Thermoplasmatota archaeon]|jgi:long-chain acyl-CoA synthetase|nr:long-chain fatty acid--CoA ligase [Candidatus Thermoplasmatota archaeon]
MTPPRTLPEMFQATAKRRGDAPALKAKLPHGGWRTITWAGYARYVRDAASFLLTLGVKEGDRVALLSKNSPEWAVTDLAILHAGAVTVPIYETLAADKIAHILKDSGARVAIAGTRAQAEKLLGLLGTRLEVVVCIEPTQGQLGKQCLDWADALRQGAVWDQEHRAHIEARWRSVKAEDLASLIYTSGTTGEPKGVMLTHGNFVSNVRDALQRIPCNEDELFLSFLPLSHSFERMAGHFVPVYLGCTVAYAESIEKLPENLLEVQPTVMNAVPRLFEKMWARVEAGAREQGKERIFQRAVETGRDYVRITRAEKRAAPFLLKLKHRAFDRLVYAKIRARVGGRVKYFVSGGAHISEELEWNFAAVGLPILGGYGLTETAPVIAVNSFEDWRPGSVGKPIPECEVRIAADGEIEVRGPNVMKGYFNLRKATNDVFTEDGWLRTGDIGHLDTDGFLFVTDRKKELFKTSGGKYVAPQPIEDQLRASPLIMEAVCVGDGKPYVAALVVPDLDALAAWAKQQGIPTEDKPALARDERCVAAIHAEIEKVNARLSKWETIKRWTLLPRELTQEHGELTPTLKVKRRVIAERYADAIAALYHDSEGLPSI